MDIVALFCDIDEFCVEFEPVLRRYALGVKQRQRASTMHLSEVLTILVWFHMIGYREFKRYYTQYVQRELRWAFPHQVSYTRFVELERDALLPLCAYLRTRYGRCTGIAFIDSTPLAVCDNRRIRSHRVFAEQAGRSQNSVGWFYGFKLHLVINDEGELLNCCLTPGNTDDRRPVLQLVKGLWGKLFGDKGYVSQPLFEMLFAHNLHLVTKLRKKMRNQLLPWLDKLLLRKRALIETVTDQLKNISQIEHTRHRSFVNCLVNLLAGLIAYTYREKKPSLHLRVDDLQLALPLAIV
jgi:DDE family transposase